LKKVGGFKKKINARTQHGLTVGAESCITRR
jgi:hypothetical protein